MKSNKIDAKEFWKDFLEGMPEDEAIKILQECQVNFHVGTVVIRDYDPNRMAFKIDPTAGKVKKGSIQFG